MLVNQAYKYELNPNNEESALLFKHAGCARFAYNWGLNEKITAYKSTGKSPNAIELHRRLNALKPTQFPWMYEVSKCAPQESLRNLDRAYQNFFRRVKNGEKPGFPRFKKKGVRDSFTISTGVMRITDNTHITLPKIGLVRTKENTDKFDGGILSVTVSREADRWYASFVVERNRQIPSLTHHGVVGIDCNVAEIVDSDDNRFVLPRPLKKLLAALQRKSRQHSKKQKGSQNKKKSAMRLAILHRRIKNTRRDFFHKLSTNLAKTKQVICGESLLIQKMSQNRFLARSIMDAGWGEFLTMLEYKATWYGSIFLETPKYFPSTKKCSVCGAVKPKMSLPERIFVCDDCGHMMDRDLNAAINIRNYAYNVIPNTGSSPGINACGEAAQLCSSLKQEESAFVASEKM